MMKYVESGDGYYHSVGYAYDDINNLTGLVETINGETFTTAYTYDDDNRIVSVSKDDATLTNTYDTYGRILTQVTTHGINANTQEPNQVAQDSYAYNNPADGATSGQIATHTITLNTREYIYTYAYDANGNITEINRKTYVGREETEDFTTSYVYDSANQLIRENNECAGYTYVWTYDNAGNILSRTEYAYTDGELGEPAATVSYGYGDSSWGDLLTSYDGKNITYDTIGNPLNDGTWTYTWQHGRQLASMTDGTTNWNYTYNADGLRTKRTDGTTTYEYVYNGSQLSQMTAGEDTLYFSYDASGTPMTVTYNGTLYHYITNVQGDVVGILNAGGGIVATYSYDAWGNLLSSDGPMADTLGALNPLRYRGYVYDSETALYYLQSRYYDPAIGRFLNADNYVATGQGFIGNNMFVYCLNNPVMYSDPSGLIIVYDDVVAILLIVVCVVAFVGLSIPVQSSLQEASSNITQYLACEWYMFTDAISSHFSNQPATDGTVAQTTATYISVVPILEAHPSRKPVNLPSWKKLTVDMSHIKSGHMPNAPRNPNGNKSVFWGLTAHQIVKAIQEAYNSSSKLHTNGVHVLLKGYSYTYNLWIEMWVNLETKVIETAYPK